MTIIPREQFNQLLTQEWPAYLARCQAFSPLERQEYLHHQGYPSLTGLLAHVVAWWQDGSLVVQRMRQEPGFQNPDYDVDAFNAQAVERFSGLSEAQMVDLFNQQRHGHAGIGRQPDRQRNKR